MTEVRKKFSEIFLAVVLVSGLAIIGFYFARGYQLLPSDDPAASVIGGRYMYEKRSSYFSNPLNPLSPHEFYSSFLAAEFPVHTALAELYSLTGIETILTTTNIFVVGIFVLAGLMIFFVFFEATTNRVLSLFGTFFVITSRWYGLMFWTGHYAQIHAQVILPAVLYLLLRHERTGERWLLLLAICLTLLLFPIHSLSFLVAVIVVLAHALTQRVLHEQRRRRWISLLVYLGGLFIVLLVLWWFSAANHYAPLFGVEDVSPGNITGIVQTSVDAILGILLVLAGAYTEILRGRYMVLVWFLVPYFFINSGDLHIPFFQYRFAEFLSAPLILLAVLGLSFLWRQVRSTTARALLLATVLTIYIPMNIGSQNYIRSCHISYCVGLNPVSIPIDDFAAYRWIALHTPEDAVVVAPSKFGIYVPAVAARAAVFPYVNGSQENEAYQVFTSPSTQTRWEQARKVKADFVLWDAALSLYGDTYQPFAAYSEKFNDKTFFEKVYSSKNVRIYSVRPP